MGGEEVVLSITSPLSAISHTLSLLLLFLYFFFSIFKQFLSQCKRFAFFPLVLFPAAGVMGSFEAGLS